MATNKHALLRYETLDKCLSDPRTKYHIEELKDACNDAIRFEYGEVTPDQVKTRQIYYDLKYLEEHYGAPIERIPDSYSRIIRYSDPNFSIRKVPLNQNEMIQLKDTLNLLGRIKGLPNNEWVEEWANRLSAEFSLNTDRMVYVSFEQKEEAPGIGHFSPILDAITAKQVIKFQYEPYNQKKNTVVLSPHFLKQYNHRWYVLGHEEGMNYTSIRALDRIRGNIKSCKKPYIECTVDYSDGFFKDIIGVTHYEDCEVEEYILQVDDDYIGYFESNPIHDTLHRVRGKRGCYKMKVRYNLELVNVIFAHLDKIKILQDPSGKLTAELKRRWEKAGEKMRGSSIISQCFT